MPDLTRPDRGEAMQRLTTTLEEMGEESEMYLLCIAGMLAKEAPDVLTFLMDQVEANLDKVAAQHVLGTVQ